MNSILAMVAARVAGGGAGGTCAESEAGCAAEGEELLAGNDAGERAPRLP